MTGSRPHPDDLAEHAVFLRALARGLVNDAARADDLVQDTLVVALQRPPDASAVSLRGWLATVVRRLASNVHRGERRRARRERLAARDEAVASHTEALERLELARDIAGLVAALAEPYRTVVYLRYHEGLGPTAIAGRLGVPVKTVKTRLSRALAEVRGRLDRRDGGLDRCAPALAALAFPGGATLGLAPLLTGGLMMKKLVAVAAAFVVVWVAYRGLTPDRRPAHPGPTGAAAAPRSAPAVDAPPPAAAPPRVPVVAPADREPVPFGSLVVQLTWKDDHRPVADLGVDLMCTTDPAPRDAFRHAVSDARGELHLPRLFAGKVRLMTVLGHRFDLEVEAGTDRRLDVALDRFDEVAGQVVAPDGTAVGGAEIWTASSGGFWPSGHRLAVTGPDGRFRLRGPHPEFAIGARAAGYRPSLTFDCGTLPVGAGAVRTVTFELGEPGGRLVGRVLAPDGTPVAAAIVRAGAPGGHIVDLPTGQRGEAPVPVPVATDAAGAFVYPSDLDPGTQPLHVLADGFPVWAGTVEIVAGEQAVIEVRLARPARVLGRVVLPDGTPAAGARVVASAERGGGWHDDAFPPPRAEADADGRFVLDLVAPGPQELNARVDGQPRLGRARATARCVEGETTEVELVLELGATIRGRVVDVDGRPLVGWGVYGEPAFRGMTYPRQDRTDDEGAFLLANLGGEGGWDLRVAAPGEFPHPPRAEVVGVPLGSTGVEIVVARTATERATLRGRLLDADGRVPRDVSVTVWALAGDSGLFADLDPETGEFVHVSNAAGRHQVRVLRGGQTVARSEVVELYADQVTDVGLLQIAGTSSVTVALRGVPAEQLDQVLCFVEDPGASGLELERDGALFRGTGIAAGRFVVRVRGGRWFVPDALIEVRPGEPTQVELDARPAFEVQLAMRFANADWSTATVEIRDEAGALLRRGGPWRRAEMAGDELRYHGLSLPAGRCSVRAATDDGQSALAELDISAAPGSRGPHRLDLR